MQKRLFIKHLLFASCDKGAYVLIDDADEVEFTRRRRCTQGGGKQPALREAVRGVKQINLVNTCKRIYRNSVRNGFCSHPRKVPVVYPPPHRCMPH